MWKVRGNGMKAEFRQKLDQQVFSRPVYLASTQKGMTIRWIHRAVLVMKEAGEVIRRKRKKSSFLFFCHIESFVAECIICVFGSKRPHVVVPKFTSAHCNLSPSWNMSAASCAISKESRLIRCFACHLQTRTSIDRFELVHSFRASLFIQFLLFCFLSSNKSHSTSKWR